jgi:hypothetical protein
MLGMFQFRRVRDEFRQIRAGRQDLGGDAVGTFQDAVDPFPIHDCAFFGGGLAQLFQQRLLLLLLLARPFLQRPMGFQVKHVPVPCRHIRLVHNPHRHPDRRFFEQHFNVFIERTRMQENGKQRSLAVVKTKSDSYWIFRSVFLDEYL